MGISHISVDLRLRHQSGHRVHDHYIHSAGANHHLRNLQRLLAVIRLRNIEVINIHADILCIDRIQGMLRVDKTGDPAPFLNLGHHMESHRCFTAGFRAVNLDHTSPRHASQSQGNIQTQRSRGNRFNIHIRTGISQLHHGAFSIRSLNLCQGRVQRFQLIIFIHESVSISPRVPAESILNANKCSVFSILLYGFRKVNRFFHSLSAVLSPPPPGRRQAVCHPEYPYYTESRRFCQWKYSTKTGGRFLHQSPVFFCFVCSALCCSKRFCCSRSFSLPEKTTTISVPFLGSLSNEIDASC